MSRKSLRDVLMERDVERWGRGTGKIEWKRHNNIIRIMENIGAVYNENEKLVEGPSVTRAYIWWKGPRNYRLVLFQGQGHKDTVYETNRWMNVRETIGNHLCDIDRALERPLTKWRLPTEEECFRPQRGDVVVLHGNFTEGDIGLVIKSGCINTSILRWSNNYPNGGKLVESFFPRSDTNAFEVIDHDEDLLKDPKEPSVSFKPGDVVVFTKPETTYLGEFGIIRDRTSLGSYHIDNGFFYPGQSGDFYASEFEVIDHDEDLLKEPKEPSVSFKPGDKVVTVAGSIVGTFEGMMLDGIRTIVDFNGIKDVSNKVKDLIPYREPETPKGIEPLDLPGGKGSWLLALDLSGSMMDDDIRGFIANHLDEFKYKVAETVTFDTTIRHKYAGMPSTCDLDRWQSRGGTEIDCVLGHALVNGYHNVLVFSDGYFSNEYAVKTEERLNVLIVKTPDGKPETLIEDKYLPLTPKADIPPSTLSTEIIHNLFQVENSGYSWAIAHVLNEKELCLVRTCRHCTEKKAIRLIDIKF